MDKDKVYALIDEIASKEKEAADLLAKLPRSLAIKDMWPEAFEHGSVTTSWRGPIMTVQEARDKEQQLRLMRKDRQHSRVAATPRDLGPDALFTIKRGDGSTRTFTKDEVPDTILDLPLRVANIGH